MRTIQQDEAQHSAGDHRRGCCGGPRGHVEDTAVARRSALEERQRDLEQELADVAQQLRDLPADEPEASE
jgi:uncharacterized protein involved in exopolysaccharide biosynthesis